MKDAYQFLKTLLKEKDTVVVGVSGGPDSMALLGLLLSVRKEIPFQMVCAHVNHNKRKESEEEKIFVEDFCKKNKIFFEYYKITSYKEDNFHNEARMIRYHFFEEIIQKYHASYLMTAHHGDDLMETILMRMVRGSTLKGYSGFEKVIERSSYKIVRPLITTTKEELETYVMEHKIPYGIDASNKEDVYTRNRFRKYILPRLKEENPKVHEKFYKFSKTLLEYQDYVEKEVQEKYSILYKDKKLNIPLFLKEEKLIQKCVLSKMLEEFYQDDLMFITDTHLELLWKLIKSKKANGMISLPKEVIGKKEYEVFYLEESKENTSYQFEFDSFLELPCGVIQKVKEEKGNSNFVCRLSSLEITLPLLVRTKQDGDKMEVKGLHGTKKVSEIFINEKIPKSKREILPVVTDSNGHILWIPGIKKSKFDKTKEEKYDIILKYDPGRRNI